jgi:EpsI family protein
MKGSIWVAVRLVLTAALVLVTYMGVLGMKSFLKLPPIQQLSLDIRELPMKLGEWQGEDQELDKATFDRTGADVAVRRAYHDAEDHSMSMLLASYSDPDAGLYHSPTNCYRSSGWRLVEDSKVNVTIPGAGPQQIYLGTWEKRGETILVAYWYRLGNYTLFQRWDMFWVRMAMRGQATWPPLVKVLLQTPYVGRDSYHCQARIKDMVVQVQQWLNQSNAGERPQGAGK